MQTNPSFPGPWECLSQTLKNEGVKGLYKVLGVMLVIVGIDSAACWVVVYGFGDVGEFAYLSAVDQGLDDGGEVDSFWAWDCGCHGRVYG